MLALIVVEGCAIVLLGLLVAGLLRSHAEILRALHELGAGLDPASESRRPQDLRITGRPANADPTAYDISGAGLDDEAVALAIVGAPRPVLLAFLTSGCATCINFWTAFRDPGLVVPGGARLVIVAKDAAEESETRLRELAPPQATVVLSSAAWADYAVPASPYFVNVDGPAGRVIGEGAAATWGQVVGLMAQALADNGARSGRQSRESVDVDAPDRIDRELLASGIGPGHPSLYAVPAAEAPEPRD